MESLKIEIINPKAKKLLEDLADLNLISIQDLSEEEVDEEAWNSLTKKQQEGIFKAMKEIKEGKGIPHEEVMAKFRRKLADA
jgi:predicted transcriptional regulator